MKWNNQSNNYLSPISLWISVFPSLLPPFVPFFPSIYLPIPHCLQIKPGPLSTGLRTIISTSVPILALCILHHVHHSMLLASLSLYSVL